MSGEENRSANKVEGLETYEIDKAEAEIVRNKVEEELNNEVEASAENRDPTAEQKKASLEALDEAATTEKPANEVAERELAKPERKRGKPSEKKRNQAYDTIMEETRASMSPSGKAFSKVIHNRAIEVTSETVGSTVARPNAVLAGSVSAFIVVLGVYLVARYFGYPLSGSETFIAFAGGWLIGILFDFLRVMITGKK